MHSLPSGNNPIFLFVVFCVIRFKKQRIVLLNKIVFVSQFYSIKPCVIFLTENAYTPVAILVCLPAARLPRAQPDLAGGSEAAAA